MLDRSNDLSLVNHLPVEVLTHIFLLIVQQYRCSTQPTWLAQVCSRWRSVALRFSYLWSHIDYSAHEFNSQSSSDWFASRNRAGLHIARSGGGPLEIHISGSLHHDDEDMELSNGTKQFFKSIAPQMATLKVDLDETIIDDSLEPYKEVIRVLLSHSTPGRITKLVTKYPMSSVFIMPFDGDFNNHAAGEIFDVVLPIDNSRLEEVFASITVLRASGLQPHWSSSAYRGLVELCITTGDFVETPISESEFMNILKASPQLRILHFSYPIITRSESGVCVSPVTLHHLEVLRIRPHEPLLEVDDVLRFIAPGSEPLSLSIRRYVPEEKFVDKWNTHSEETESFLARAQVAKLYVSKFSFSDRLFKALSHLQILILHHYNHSLAPLSPSDDSLVSLPTIECCYLLECTLELGRLYPMVQHCSVRKLVLVGCKFYSDGKEVAQEEVQPELARICPVVEFARRDLRLGAYRELIGRYAPFGSWD